jgi:hypothetical protein
VEECFDFSTRHFSSQGFISPEALAKRLGGFTDILDMVVTPLPGIETGCEILSALLYRLSSVIKHSFIYQPLSHSTLPHKTYIG